MGVTHCPADARSRVDWCQPPARHDRYHTAGQGGQTGTRLGRPRFHCFPAEPALDCRHHLRADGERFSLSRSGSGSLEPQDCRLVDGQPSADRTGAGRAGDGDRPAAAGRRHPSQRPKAANTHRWRSANVAGRLASGRQWDRSAMPTTTPCARASSPRSNASCWSAAGSRPRSRPRWPASASSKVGTARSGCTQPSATARQWPMKQRWRRSRQNRNHPSPTPLYETGVTSAERIPGLDVAEGYATHRRQRSKPSQWVLGDEAW
jgi:hypothetical protein